MIQNNPSLELFTWVFYCTCTYAHTSHLQFFYFCFGCLFSFSCCTPVISLWINQLGKLFLKYKLFTPLTPTSDKNNSTVPMRLLMDLSSTSVVPLLLCGSPGSYWLRRDGHCCTGCGRGRSLRLGLSDSAQQYTKVWSKCQLYYMHVFLKFYTSLHTLKHSYSKHSIN